MSTERAHRRNPSGAEGAGGRVFGGGSLTLKCTKSVRVAIFVSPTTVGVRSASTFDPALFIDAGGS